MGIVLRPTSYEVCQYCGKHVFPELIAVHEETCFDNPNLKQCFTCKHFDDKIFNEWEKCLKGEDPVSIIIDEIRCSEWKPKNDNDGNSE